MRLVSGATAIPRVVSAVPQRVNSAVDSTSATSVLALSAARSRCPVTSSDSQMTRRHPHGVLTNRNKTSKLTSGRSNPVLVCLEQFDNHTGHRHSIRTNLSEHPPRSTRSGGSEHRVISIE